MLRTVSFVVIVFVSFLPGFILNTTQAAQFSADLTVDSPDMKYEAKIYVSGNRYRLENLEGGNQLLLIRKNGKSWALNPEEKQYRQLKGPEENFLNPVASWENLSYDMQGKQVGTDVMGGYECEKFDYNYKNETEVVLERWFSRDLEFVLKQILHAQNGDAVMLLQNINEKSLDESIFQIPEDYMEALPLKKEKSKAEATTPQASSGKESGEAPWGRYYSASGEVRVTMNPKMKPMVKIINESDGESVCKLITVKKGKESKPRNITLNTKDSENEPFLGSKGIEVVIVKVERGEVFVIIEQKADMLSEIGPAEDRFFKMDPKYNVVAKGFIVDANKDLIIKLVADCPDSPVTKGYFSIYRGNYSDEIERVEFSFKHGEYKTWEYTKDKKIGTWEFSLLQGAAKVSYWQPQDE